MANGEIRILLIDNNTYISQKIAEQISSNGPGCCVSQCHSMACAHRLFATHSFKLVLMDALTASISEHIFQQIRNRNPDVKIMLYSTKLTGAEFAAVNTAAMECGADFFGDEGDLINQVRDEFLAQNRRTEI